MEENKDLMVQEEETTIVDLDTYDCDDEATEENKSSGFSLTALAVAGLIGAGIALGAKRGYAWLKNRGQSKKNIVEVKDVKDVIPDNESDDSDEDENEEK